MKFFSIFRAGKISQAAESVKASKPREVYGKSFVLEGHRTQLMGLKKPWGERLVLHGLTYSESKAFVEDFVERLELGPGSSSASYVETFHNIFLELTAKHASNHRLFTAGNHRHELQAAAARGNQSVNAERFRGLLALEQLVEIGYRRLRLSERGVYEVDTHIHRVKLRRVKKDRIVAHDGVGIRTYLLDRIQWATPLGKLNVKRPYFMDVVLHLEGGSPSYRAGLFLGPEKGIVSDYAVVRNKGYYPPGITPKDGFREVKKL